MAKAKVVKKAFGGLLKAGNRPGGLKPAPHSEVPVNNPVVKKGLKRGLKKGGKA